VFETGAVGKGAQERPAFKLYEHVAGAELVGAAPPGTRVEASLALRTEPGRALLWRTSARADADGRFSIRVPYPTRGGPPGVASEGPYVVAGGDREARVAVDEAAVRAGAKVEVPALYGSSGSEASGSAPSAGSDSSGSAPPR
jgi:hypothetical protein